jgi:hypothetical protein
MLQGVSKANGHPIYNDNRRAARPPLPIASESRSRGRNRPLRTTVLLSFWNLVPKKSPHAANLGGRRPIPAFIHQAKAIKLRIDHLIRNRDANSRPCSMQSPRAPVSMSRNQVRVLPTRWPSWKGSSKPSSKNVSTILLCSVPDTWTICAHSLPSTITPSGRIRKKKMRCLHETGKMKQHSAAATSKTESLPLSKIRCGQRLGGLLKHYYRVA